MGQYRDLLVALLVILIVLIIIIPIPKGLLDLLLAFSLGFSLVILMTTMFTTDALQFSVFPSLLLITTLLRLSLNISSTRLILLYADAGDVIAAFGEFVVGGDFVVGLVVFLIITVIQFVVITSGAGRVAEVAARFTLDAMPGKQMSIDADLNAGLLTEDEARQKRKALQQEADFFGAMDGASKFVRGDAIAGIVIILVNIAGGLVMGIWRMGMEPMEAVNTYIRLTVGDGLVSQLPALLVSTATGILVTRAGAEQSLGEGLTAQLTAFPKVIVLVSGILAVMALLPGLPALPFLALAAAAAYLAYNLNQNLKAKDETAHAQQAATVTRQPENVLNLLKVEPMEIEIGYNLIPLTDESQGGDLLERLTAVRRQSALELGMYVKPIRIRDNLQLKANEYVFKIHGVDTERGETYPGLFLAMNPGGSEETVRGTPTTEPTFGLPAWWISREEKERLEINGFTVVDASTVLVTHLTEFIKRHAAELLGRQEVKEMLETVKEQYPAVVEELVPDLLTYGEIQKVLQNLLREQVPIRDLVTLLETMADSARVTKDIDYLTEACRQALNRTISAHYAPQGKLEALLLDPEVEELLAGSLKQTSQGMYPVLEPATIKQLIEKLGREFEQKGLAGAPVVVCSSRVRLPFKRLVERYLPEVAVLAINELAPTIEVDAVGRVSLK